MRREAHKAALWVGIVGLSMLAVYISQLAAGDLRRRWCSPRCSTAVRACWAGCCRSGAAGASHRAVAASCSWSGWATSPARRFRARPRSSRPSSHEQVSRLIAWLRAHGFDIKPATRSSRVAGQVDERRRHSDARDRRHPRRLGTIAADRRASASTSRSSRGSTSAASAWMLPPDQRGDFSGTAAGWPRPCAG